MSSTTNNENNNNRTRTNEASFELIFIDDHQNNNNNNNNNNDDEVLSHASTTDSFDNNHNNNNASTTTNHHQQQQLRTTTTPMDEDEYRQQQQQHQNNNNDFILANPFFEFLRGLYPNNNLSSSSFITNNLPNYETLINEMNNLIGSNNNNNENVEQQQQQPASSRLVIASWPTMSSRHNLQPLPPPQNTPITTNATTMTENNNNTNNIDDDIHFFLSQEQQQQQQQRRNIDTDLYLLINSLRNRITELENFKMKIEAKNLKKRKRNDSHNEATFDHPLFGTKNKRTNSNTSGDGDGHEQPQQQEVPYGSFFDEFNGMCLNLGRQCILRNKQFADDEELMTFTSYEQKANFRNLAIQLVKQENFIVKNDDEIPLFNYEDYICSICFEGLIDPVKPNICDHYICTICSAKIKKNYSESTISEPYKCATCRSPFKSFVPPTRDTKRIMTILQFKCPYCSETVNMANALHHITHYCLKCPLPCPRKSCSQIFDRETLQDHFENGCMHGTVSCEYCLGWYTKQRLPLHYRRCRFLHLYKKIIKSSTTISKCLVNE